MIREPSLSAGTGSRAQGGLWNAACAWGWGEGAEACVRASRMGRAPPYRFPSCVKCRSRVRACAQFEIASSCFKGATPALRGGWRRGTKEGDAGCAIGRAYCAMGANVFEDRPAVVGR